MGSFYQHIFLANAVFIFGNILYYMFNAKKCQNEKKTNQWNTIMVLSDNQYHFKYSLFIDISQIYHDNITYNLALPNVKECNILRNISRQWSSRVRYYRFVVIFNKRFAKFLINIELHCTVVQTWQILKYIEVCQFLVRCWRMLILIVFNNKTMKYYTIVQLHDKW